ncbi:MAG: HAMP domain-containing histidine kinase [Eubacteriaceae bacterium]|nr:HAMP domain-containing histidine kinase [Eubacteriaceae bacterium]
MKLRYSAKMILAAVIITIITAVLVGSLIIGGMREGGIRQRAAGLKEICEAAASTLPDEVFNGGGEAEYAAKRISGFYGNDTVILNSEGTPAAASFYDEDYSIYSDNAKGVLAEDRPAYIYSTGREGGSIVVFLPVKREGVTIGILAMREELIRAEVSYPGISRMFFTSVCLALVSAILIYLPLHYLAVRPLRKLALYFHSSASDETVPFPEINAAENDTVGRLVSGYRQMRASIDEKIGEVNYERDKLSAIVSSMRDGVIAVNGAGEITTINARAKEFFRGSESYLSAIPDHEKMIAAALADEKGALCETEYGGRNLVISAVAIDPDEEDGGVLFVISDNTAVKKAQDEQNRFISSVSHELRTPLTTVIGYINMLKRRGTSDKTITYKALNSMDEESHRLLRLVNDLISMGRLKNYEFNLNMTDIDLDELLSEIASQMNLTAEKNKVAVAYESVKLPPVSGDRDRLKQALLNISDNAVKYSHPGDAVRITAIKLEGFIEITVRDYGDGIPEDKLSRIFEPFYRVEDDRTRVSDKGGYGLGLPIAKEIIEHHNGTIGIESVEGSGTLAVIRLPYRQTEEKDLGEYGTGSLENDEAADTAFKEAEDETAD